MRNTLESIVASIVENPDGVKVTEEETNELITFSIAVDPADVGKVIGKEGKIIRAIRNVMKIPAIKQNKRINIVLDAPQPKE